MIDPLAAPSPAVKRTKKYDLIVVPGLMFGPHWGMRRDLMMRLRVAARLYRWNPGAHIAVCGRWSIWYDWLKITPPVTEAKLMKRYLTNLGVDPEHIVMESTSKDTPGNVYYLKRYLRTMRSYRRLMVVCAAPTEKRLRFLFHKFFERSYTVSFLPVNSPHFNKNVTGDEETCLQEEKALLQHVRRGHEEDFERQLYTNPYYRQQAANVRRSGLTLRHFTPRVARLISRP